MKATIDFEEGLYHRLKVEAARRGLTIRELVEDGVRHVLDHPPEASRKGEEDKEPKWFASLNEYAVNASGKHDLAAMRKHRRGAETTAVIPELKSLSE